MAENKQELEQVKEENLEEAVEEPKLSEKDIKRVQRAMKKVATREEVIKTAHMIGVEITKPIWDKLKVLTELQNTVHSLVAQHIALVRFILDKKLAESENELQKYLDEVMKEAVENARKENEKEDQEEGERKEHEGDVNDEKAQE